MTEREENQIRQPQDTNNQEDEEIGYDINTGNQTSMHLILKRRKRLILLFLILIIGYLVVFYFNLDNLKSDREEIDSKHDNVSSKSENSSDKKIDESKSNSKDELSKLASDFQNSSSSLSTSEASNVKSEEKKENNNIVDYDWSIASSSQNNSNNNSEKNSNTSSDKEFDKKLSDIFNLDPIISTKDYVVYKRFHRSAMDFTQGLFFDTDTTLVESTGLYKHSVLKRYDFDNPDNTYWEIKLNDNYFGEGACMVNDNILQLTWKEKIILKYKYGKPSLSTGEVSAPLLTTINTTDIKIKEGYGITWDFKNSIYITDSTSDLKIIEINDPDMKVSSILPITEKNKPVSLVNELEFANGKIYANIWLTDDIVIINPTMGNIEKRISFSNLVDYEQKHIRRNSDMNVLNGIAYNKKGDFFILTGKYWSGMYVVKFTGK